ncbi:Acetyl co-enzyme A carboxylase carboxyltransferase alpha subunit [Sphingobacterium spiritivorum ATCC 33300]|uniref:acetyl-CoA carboxytransferase n=1 Tax=Sphingobacterium spiritivorum ATCC 33300 TaxID=525372 RepID=C2G482_SPHSI|nr:Acetyl co-enzyme A carboxylase carboxyltransferase alpha subunit [Sphingobacterium spiritivorum ATCC 33300]
METTFDFEKPIADLQTQIEKVNQVAEKTKVDMSATIQDLEAKLEETKLQIYNNMTGWQKVQMSRHPERPQTFDYIEMICEEFIELHGDRNVKDDKAIVGGFASIGGEPVMVIGHQKGKNNQGTSVPQLWNGKSRGIPQSFASDENG